MPEPGSSGHTRRRWPGPARRERYLYPSEYFERLFGSDRSWLVLATRDGDRLAGAIAVACDGYLHYYLGGTADEALADSPMKNLFAAMISLGAELGLPVNLGGGLASGDSLDDFKRGFANGEAPFRTHELICDPAAYERLAAQAGPAPEGFFPAYAPSRRARPPALLLRAASSLALAFGEVLDPLLHRRRGSAGSAGIIAPPGAGRQAERVWPTIRGTVITVPAGIPALRAARGGELHSAGRRAWRGAIAIFQARNWMIESLRLRRRAPRWCGRRSRRSRSSAR